MKKIQFADRIRTAVLMTEDLNPIEFTLTGSDQTDQGLVLHGQILIPHKGKAGPFGILVMKEWDDDQAAMAFLGFLRNVKKSVEEALKSGVMEDAPEPPPPGPALLDVNGQPIQSTHTNNGQAVPSSTPRLHLAD